MTRDIWNSSLKQRVVVETQLVKSEMDQADKYTGQGLDRGDYTLNKTISAVF